MMVSMVMVGTRGCSRLVLLRFPARLGGVGIAAAAARFFFAFLGGGFGHQLFKGHIFSLFVGITLSL